MITIPISFIAIALGITMVGAFVGFLFTVIFMFGCDTKYFRQNAIIGIVTAWVVFSARFLTDAGVIVWQ